MDKRKSLLNIIVSILFKVILVILSIFVKRELVINLGNEVNGLNSLFMSIIGVLSVAELGVGTSIIFCMYKPIVEGDDKKVSALYGLYKKVYILISIVILLFGLLLLPFLKYFVRDLEQISFNIYISFILMIVAVCITYLFSAKISLINAYKNKYVTTIINSTGLIVQYLLQLLVIFILRSYYFYLIVIIISSLIQWIMTDLYTNKHYKKIITVKCKIDTSTKCEVSQKVRAMFIHKIGEVLVNTIDSVIISTFVGVIILGKYSNYIAIMSSMVGLISLFFTPLTSIIGHTLIKESKESVKSLYNSLHFINFCIGCIFFFGYYSIIDNIIILLFGKELILSNAISFTITVNYFVQFMRYSTLLFRDASGTFYNDRFKPIVEGVLNLVLSIIFVNVVGVVGVIVSTIITNLFICHIIEPYVLHKNALGISPKKFYMKNYLYIFIFILLLMVIDVVHINIQNVWIELLVNGSVSVVISLTICILFYIFNKKIKNDIKFLLKGK